MRSSLVPALWLCACAPAVDNVALDGERLPVDHAPPAPYALDLWSSPWIPGDTLRIQVRNVAPGDTVQVAMGNAGLSCPPPLRGACVDLDGPLIMLGSAVAGPDGIANLATSIAPGAPVGREKVMQAVSGLGGAVLVSNPWASETVAACPAREGCNLVGNGDLDDDMTPYRQALPYVGATWSPRDVDADPRSGSLEVTNYALGAYSSIWQCVPVRPGETFNYRAYGYLPAASVGNAMFGEFIFYTGDNCTGGLALFAEAPWQTITGVWVPMELTGFVAPASARSVRVGHGTIGLTGAVVSANFDGFDLRMP